jgi:hypothetical protein
MCLSIILNHFRVCVKGTYLEKPGQLQKALELESEWRSMVPGHSNATWAEVSTLRHMSSLERSLMVLREERDLEEWVELESEWRSMVPGHSNATWAEVSTLRHMSSLERSLMVLREERDLDEWVDKRKDGAIISSVNDTAYVDVTIPDGSSSNIHPVVIKGHPCLAPLPQGVELPDDIELPGRKGAVIVMIRHGKTDHNKLSLFTGWEDPPLASEGVEEAKLAGKMLKKNGFEFDIVYTSWLSRAIETSWHVLDGLDSTWLPIVKSWRLNERHYVSIPFFFSYLQRFFFSGKLMSFSFFPIGRFDGEIQGHDFSPIRRSPIQALASGLQGQATCTQLFLSRISRERQALPEIFERLTLLGLGDSNSINWQQTLDTIAKVPQDRVVIFMYEAHHSVSDGSYASQSGQGKQACSDC